MATMDLEILGPDLRSWDRSFKSSELSSRAAEGVYALRTSLVIHRLLPPWLLVFLSTSRPFGTASSDALVALDSTARRSGCTVHLVALQQNVGARISKLACPLRRPSSDFLALQLPPVPSGALQGLFLFLGTT